MRAHTHAAPRSHGRIYPFAAVINAIDGMSLDDDYDYDDEAALFASAAAMPFDDADIGESFSIAQEVSE
jgi:hypothetical protein